MTMNEMASDPSIVSMAYSWNFILNIKTAGAIKRLASANHKIKYDTSQDGTIAKVQLRQGEERNLGKDFVIHFSHEKMFEHIGFTQTNEFGE